MRRDGLSFTRALQEKQLRKDGDRLEENGERPRDLCECEAIVEDEGEQEGGSDQVLDFECVDRGVVCWSIVISVRKSNQEEVDRLGNGRRERWCHGGEAGGKHVPMFILHKVKDVAAAPNEEYLHQ